MFFQNILKGIGGLTRAEAEEILNVTGIQCNWIRTEGHAKQRDIARRLNQGELIWHLTRYDEEDDRTGEIFGATSPFISTTAGTSEQSTAMFQERAYSFSAFDTAALFATDDFTDTGWIFFGYVFTLGRQSLEHAEFAEEIRDLHIYSAGYRFHMEGEIVAKLIIPPARLQRCERYSGPVLRQAFESGVKPVLGPEDVIWNKNYADPMRYVNIRDVL
jgi:hypothetical protein